MITYLMAFIFYTLAMVGILLIGFIVYKKTFAVGKNENKGSMKILDSLQIAPKKQLLVVKIKNEKFLIASGLEHTTFLAKLQDDSNSNKYTVKEIIRKPEVKAAVQKESDTKRSYDDGFDEMYEQEQLERRHSELQQARLDKIQRQFRELYEDDTKTSSEESQKPLTRKAMVRQLLKDLNDTTSAKVGNGFNG